MKLLNTYQSVSKPAVHQYKTIKQWLTQIEFSEYSTSIESARNGYSNYDYTKKNLPAVTYNFQYVDYKNDNNCLYSTGLIFIDIDNEAFDIQTLDKTKIYSYYRSFGGKGYGILVRVEGVTYDNFKASYSTVCGELGISSFIDKNAVKASQFSVLSYDPNLYINKNPFIFDFTLGVDELNKSINNYKKDILSLNFKKVNNSLKYKTYPTSLIVEESSKEKHIREVGYVFEKPIRYTNINDFKFDTDFITNWKDGFNFVKCYLPIGKINDKRKRTLLSYTTNLIFLNPDISYLHALNILENVNKIISLRPLEKEILEGILKSILNQKNEGRLRPHYTLRRILFKVDSGLNVEDKLTICGQLIKKKFENEGCQRLNEIIEEWDFCKFGKLSVAKIAANSDMNKKTVAKYYHNFKELVKFLNEEFKNNNI